MIEYVTYFLLAFWIAAGATTGYLVARGLWKGLEALETWIKSRLKKEAPSA